VLYLLDKQSFDYFAPVEYTGHTTSSQIEIYFLEPAYISHAVIATAADIVQLD
jgi:hypothetical protein